MGAGRRCRSLLEVHRLMQVWGCVGCVGVLLPARTPSDEGMAVRPPPSDVGYLLTSLRPGDLSVVLHRQVPTPPGCPQATTH